MNYVVVYEKSATGWAAYVPDLPGVITTGPTKKDVQSLIKEAIEFHLRGCETKTFLFLNRVPLPKSSPSRSS